MPSIPAELVPILAQFPVVALVFVTAWVVLKWTDQRTAAELTREFARSEAALRRSDADAERAWREAAQARAACKAAEERLMEWQAQEITRLRSRVTRLENQLDEDRRTKPRGKQ